MEPSSCTTERYGKMVPIGYMNVPVTICNSKGRPSETDAKDEKERLESLVMRRRYDTLELTRCFCPEETVLEQYTKMHKVDSSNNDRSDDDEGSDDDYDLEISPKDPRVTGRNPKKRNYTRERKLSSTLELTERLGERNRQGRKHIDHTYSFVALVHGVHQVLCKRIHKHAPGLRITVDTMTLHTTRCKEGDKTTQIGDGNAGIEEQTFNITPENWDDLREKITDRTTREVGIEVKWSSGEIRESGNGLSKRMQKKALDFLARYREVRRKLVVRKFMKGVAKGSPLALAKR